MDLLLFIFVSDLILWVTFIQPDTFGLFFQLDFNTIAFNIQQMALSYSLTSVVKQDDDCIFTPEICWVN